jgi:asparagine synthase (glutamine-hydrolysing)
MCGIAGIFGAREDALLAAMLSKLRHRGPDDEFFVGGDGFSLGARRLSIIDLAGGRQPIANETEDVWVAQNGEIYNFPPLMESLKAAGHCFRSRSDTEVLVHLYEEKGENFVEDLNGMYAIGIWDRRKKEGLLARDRAGKKPLYYHVTDKGILYFASEIKALLTLPFLSRRISRAALHHYLSYKHVPAPLSIFEGIQMLPPAHLLIYRQTEAGQCQIDVKRYWRLDFGRVWTDGLSENEIVDRLLETLGGSVQRRLISDVPIGFFLSGGIDSSLCTALAATVSKQPVETFTLAYGPDSTTAAKEQDRRCAEMVARRYRTKHHEEVIESSHLEDDLYAIINQFDEPFAGVISAYFLARRISQHVKVAVSGDGADELFGSYLSHRLAGPIQAYVDNGKSWCATTEAAHLSAQDRKLLEEIAVADDWEWRYKLLVFSDEEKSSLYGSGLAAEMEEISTAAHLRSYFAHLTARDPLNRMLEAEFNSQLPDQVLTYVDRLSMAHSLEVRAPYLDSEFLALAAGIGGAWKIRAGETKYILKKAALRYLPEEVVYRPKEGFLLPINQWLLQNLEAYAKDLLSAERLQRHGLFNSPYVEGLVNRFYSGETQLANKVWMLMVFQIWHEIYIERAGAA